ncbi:MAG TPA: PPOX class F420-dependent oxidoreductase [Actinoplanes sp.]|jgi:PPOX class probable F420-dependent enzyme
MSDELWETVVANNLGTLATIRPNGRPHLSDVNYTAQPGLIRISTVAHRVKTHNLRRDPRASLKVDAAAGGFAVVEADAELSPIATDRHDATVEELIEVYRLVQGKEHPDWDDYRRAMVADKRLIVRLRVERLYGWLIS